MKYAHTFTRGGFVVAVVYNNSGSAKEAAMYVAAKWTKVRTEPI